MNIGMTLEEAQAILSNQIREATVFCQKLDAAGRLSHQTATEIVNTIVGVAQEQLRQNWYGTSEVADAASEARLLLGGRFASAPRLLKVSAQAKDEVLIRRIADQKHLWITLENLKTFLSAYKPPNLSLDQQGDCLVDEMFRRSFNGTRWDTE